MEKSVIEFVIRKNVVKNISGAIYEKLGLEVTYKGKHMHIKSTTKSHIKTVDEIIHIHIYRMELLDLLIEEGFVSESRRYSMPLELIDTLGNKILASFIPMDSDNNIAILTSGGDAPGMNQAIRAALKTGMKWGSRVYGVYCGYEGLITDKIELLNWNSTDMIVDDGGTFLFSTRSWKFKEQRCRKIAAYNLAKRKIRNLLVMGGDGSIKGGCSLASEFETHIKALIVDGKLDANTSTKLQVIAIPASIDNDIPYSDMTLGCDSALHRVIEAVDHIISTMVSHHRIFVIEVMGNKCGWIALMSSFATGADFVFLPEAPIKNWDIEIREAIKRAREKGKKGIFVIISEGAVDSNNKKINSSEVVDLLSSDKDNDVRLLKLGHLQRGGPPSAYDKINGTLLGIKAVKKLLSSDLEKPLLISVYDGDHRFTSLELVIKAGDDLTKYQEDRNFEKILEFRGRFFKRAYALYEQLRTRTTKASIKKKIAVINGGTRAGGMNSALHSIVRYCYSLGNEVHVIHDGAKGIVTDKISCPKEYEYVSSISNGGSVIGTCEDFNYSLKILYEKILAHKFDALIVLGSSKLLEPIQRLKKIIAAQGKTLEVVLIPSSSSNNLPFTETSLGSDTAINTIAKASETLRIGSMSMDKVVAILEVQGKNCGYLAVMGGIASGAFDTFIPERRYSINHLSETAKRLRQKFEKESRGGTILIRNEYTFSSISSEAFASLLKTDGKNLFETKYCILGFLQDGSNPSPLDRINATILGIKAVDLLLNIDEEEIIREDKLLHGLIGIKGRNIVFTDIDQCIAAFDLVKDVPIDPEWLVYSNIPRSVE